MRQLQQYYKLSTNIRFYYILFSRVSFVSDAEITISLLFVLTNIHIVRFLR